MEDKKLLYGILAVCVVTLVVSGISVYEVNTVAKQLNTQGEQIAALQEAQAPMNVLYVELGEQLNTQRDQIAALEQSRYSQDEMVLRKPEAEIKSVDVEETEAEVESVDVEDEGINFNDPPENRVPVMRHSPAPPLDKSATDDYTVRDAG